VTSAPGRRGRHPGRARYGGRAADRCPIRRPGASYEAARCLIRGGHDLMECSPACAFAAGISVGRTSLTEQGPPEIRAALVQSMSGDVLLSHAVARAVPSALRGLASGFGMGPGVSLSLWSPKLYGDMARAAGRPPKSIRRRSRGDRTSGTAQWTLALGGASPPEVFPRAKPAEEDVVWQVLGLLVPVSCTCYHASTSGLSTRWSSRGPYSIKDGRSHLEASFPLRCFQRLSLPNVANQQCSWRNNWHTRGSSVPVLSY
jgi:hypothetical protein